MTKFAAILIAISQLIMSLFFPGNTTTAPEDKSDFVPVLRFEVMSDTHIKSLGDKRCKRIQKAVSLAYDDAEKDANYNTLDAVLFAGDITDDGKKAEFHAFKGTVNSCFKDETKLLTIIHKGHDCSHMGRDARGYISGVSDLENDWHVVINGYHFIGISVCDNPDSVYSEAQRTWLKTQLDEAVKEDPTKPVFVTHHEHVKDTVYGSSSVDGWGQDYFKDIFEQYPQIVHFSGHSHYPLNDPRSIWQGDFTAIGTGGIHYMEFTLDGVNCVHPDNNNDCAQCWIVEVDKDNRVRLRGYDALSSTLLCEYILNNIADPEKREFTPAQQEEKASAPEFESGAKLDINKSGSNYTVTIPAAKSTDGSIIFAYRACVYNTQGELTDSAVIINDYWRFPQYDSVKLKVNAPDGSVIKATAENAYGMQSTPLEYTV